MSKGTIRDVLIILAACTLLFVLAGLAYCQESTIPAAVWEKAFQKALATCTYLVSCDDVMDVPGSEGHKWGDVIPACLDPNFKGKVSVTENGPCDRSAVVGALGQNIDPQTVGRVCWASRVTKAHGCGEWATMGLAKEWAQSANEQEPLLSHWAEPFVTPKPRGIRAFFRRVWEWR